MKKSTHKRLTAWLLTLALVVTLLPGMGMTALAVEDGGEGNGPPAVEVVDPEDESSGTDETVESPPSTEPESKEEDKTTEGEGGSSGSDYDIEADTQPRGLMRALAAPTAADDYPAANVVSVDNGKTFAAGRLYFRNGEDGCSSNSTDYNAYYDPTTGTLTLKNYNGKRIAVGGALHANITVKLVGTNTINGGVLESSVGGDITITSDSKGTLSITHTLNGGNDAIGIKTGLTSGQTTGNVTIKGDAKVTINVTHNGTNGYDNAYGIYAKENITISEDASVDITCATPNNTTGGYNCNGLVASKKVIIDTNGEIKINVKNAGGDDAYSYGIFPTNGATLTKVGNMEVKWKKHASVSLNSGGVITGSESFSDTDHAINVDKPNCYASYRYGTPRTVMVKNGTLTGPGVLNAKSSGKFLENDTVSITPYERKGKSGEDIPFKGWTSSDVTLSSPTTAANSFTVPNKDVTVTAKHDPFDGTPTFTPTGTTNTTGTLTFKTKVKLGDGTECFYLAKDGEQNDESKYISFRTDNSPSTSPYEYNYETRTLPGINQVDEGDYYVVEKLDGTYYLSEKFTVNYVKPRPEISTDWWFDPTDFGSVEVDYTHTTGRNLTITNKGAAGTGELTITVEGKNPDAFTVSKEVINNIPAGGNAVSTVRPKTGLAAGIYTATLKISGDNVNTLSLNMKFTVKDPNASATVSGTIKSYGSASEAVTVTLLQGTSVIGSPQVLTGASGSVPYSQNYSFPAVPAGDYTLKVEKKGHAPWTEEITVGSTAIAKDVTVYLWGDVNRDGEVTAADAQEIQRKAAGLSSVFDTDPNSAYCTLRADVNKDEKVTAADAQEIQRKAAGLSSTISTLP